MKFEFSAGGVVHKTEQGKLWILLSQHAQHHGWVFPKGLIGDVHENESKEDTAVREVKEETGIDGEIESQLAPVSYFYEWNGEKIKKTVYYFIMKHLGGDINVRDDEMEEVEWLLFDDVEDRLTYPSDKQVWKEARKILSNQNK